MHARERRSVLEKKRGNRRGVIPGLKAEGGSSVASASSEVEGYPTGSWYTAELRETKIPMDEVGGANDGELSFANGVKELLYCHWP